MAGLEGRLLTEVLALRLPMTASTGPAAPAVWRGVPEPRGACFVREDGTEVHCEWFTLR